MGPMLFNPVSDGPAMVLSPAQDHPFAQFPSQSMFDAASGSLQTYASGPNRLSMNGQHQSSYKPAVNHSWKSASSSTPVYANPSRKRSRDDFADEANGEQYEASVSLTPAPAPVPEEEPVYGEGMVLLNPRTGMVISAESQTGTWYEENVEHVTAAAPPVSSRSTMLHANVPDISSRKSQRLDTSAPGLDDIALASIRQRLQSTSYGDEHRRSLNGSNDSPSFTPNDPQVDNFTYLLGISWQRINTNDDMAPAVRGWAKYIDNHYARYLQDAQILLKNRGMNAYLVAARPVTDITSSACQMTGASPSFYLFSDDLAQGQLVGSNWDTCLRNLRAVPIVFEGTEVLRAAEKSPERVVEDKGILINSVASNGIPAAQVSPASGVSFGHGNNGLNGGVGMGMGMDIDS